MGPIGVAMSLTAKELAEQATEHRLAGHYEEALASAIAATKANPDHANGWWQTALARMALGDPRNAIPAFERTVELSPNFAAGWAKLGSAHVKAGDDDAALEAFERASRIEESQEALNGLADIYQKRNVNGETPTTEALDRELEVLLRLEKVTNLTMFQANRVGNIMFRIKNYMGAEIY